MTSFECVSGIQVSFELDLATTKGTWGAARAPEH